MAFNRRRRVYSQKAIAAFQVSELLEERRLLTSYGNAWADARSLSVSFPSDLTPIGAQTNQLRSTLDAVAARAEWQTTALRAIQQWAEVANVNIGLVADRGDAFGTVGLSSNDPRFGEIRIGAFAQSGVLASSIPNQPAAGTWSGDILLNSQVDWMLADPGQRKATQAGAIDLFTVVMHESGNSLGLMDRTEPGYVMSGNYNGAHTGLTATDISDIRQIYGVRQDLYEPVSNDTNQSATAISMNASALAAERVVTRGSLNSASDADYYSFTVAPGKTSATITLWAAGISLLEGGIEVRKASGGLVGDSQAQSVFQNNARVTLTGLNAGETYSILVDHVKHTAFSVGDYELDIDYRDASQMVPSKAKNHDSGIYSGKQKLADADTVSVDQLFSNGLVDLESGSNESLSSATVLTTAPGFAAASRYEALGSVSTLADRDLFTLTAPSVALSGLNVDLTPLGSNPGNFDVVVMNAQGDRVVSRVIRSSSGQQSVQVVNPVAGASYVVGIKGQSGAAIPTGNYVLTVDFAAAEVGMKSLFSGALMPGVKDYSLLTTTKSQLFRFDLSTLSSTTQQASQVTLVDVRTQSVVRTISAIGGTNSTVFVWLPEGDYVVIAATMVQGVTGLAPVSFKVTAGVVSDDEGPSISGDTSGTTPTGDSFVWTDIPVDVPPLSNDNVLIVQDPWADLTIVDLAINFYENFLGL
jgi:hypothetical protein